MTKLYTDVGSVVPVTLIQLYKCLVTKIFDNNEKNYNTVLLSYGELNNPEKKLNKPILCFYKKLKLNPYLKMKSVRFTKENVVNVGDVLSADLLKDVMYVDVTGISKGKGFAGGMKRYGFHGLDAQHGVSISHRSIGSTGNRMSPSKVFKGKRMPGHLGNVQTTVKNLKVVRVDVDDNILCVKGSIPGYNGSDLVIKTIKR